MGSALSLVLDHLGMVVRRAAGDRDSGFIMMMIIILTLILEISTTQVAQGDPMLPPISVITEFNEFLPASAHLDLFKTWM